MVEVKLKIILKVIDFMSYKSYFQKMDDVEFQNSRWPGAISSFTRYWFIESIPFVGLLTMNSII